MLQTSDTELKKICSVIDERKVIIPFSQNSFVCKSLNTDKNIAYVDLSNYFEIEEYSLADRIVSVQCGIKIVELQKFLVSKGLWLPVNCCDEQTSLLDLILTGDADPYENVNGGLRRHLLGLSFILPNGQIAKSGGKVVKNVSGYDLTRFLLGSYGYFALPVKAQLRLYDLPPKTLSIGIDSPNFAQLLNIANKIISTRLSLLSLDIVDRKLMSSESIERGVKSDRLRLMVTLFGDESQISKNTTEFRNICKENNLSISNILDRDEQERELRQLTAISSPKNKFAQTNHKEICFIDILCDRQKCGALLQLPDLHSKAFTFRPISSKLRVYLNSSSEQESALDSLNKYSIDEQAPLVVAYNNNEYIRKVARLGNRNKLMEETIFDLKQRLKEKLDPDCLFNPFVDL